MIWGEVGFVSNTELQDKLSLVKFKQGNVMISKGEHKEKINKIYKWMMNEYGPQGWWPVLSCKVSNPIKKDIRKGYHPKEYSYPKNANQRFEICAGAILTQNTAWKNVEKALNSLKYAQSLSPRALMQLDDQILKDLIRPAGYYNQKSKYLRNFTEFFLSLKGKTPGRKELLQCRGIGDETADSILLYAYSRPEFVIDAYTKRIFSHLGFIRADEKYLNVKELFETAVAKDIPLYQEYHALIVEHAKQYYSRKPYGEHDPLKQRIK